MTQFLPTERLPPIASFEPSTPISRSNSNFSSTSSRRGSSPRVLPPVSTMVPTPPTIPLLSPIHTPTKGGFTSPTNQSPQLVHTPPQYLSQLPKKHSFDSYQVSERSSPTSVSSNGSTHYSYQQDAPSQYDHRSPTSSPMVMSPSHLSHHHSYMNRSTLHHHHPYSTQSQIYPSNGTSHSQQLVQSMDPASELLAEKRRRNAGASARFRDRRKQSERDMQEKCQYLERRVQELENMDSAKQAAEWQKKFDQANSENLKAQSKIKELEEEINYIRNQSTEYSYALTPPSSSGESDHKEFFEQSRFSRKSSISMHEHRAPKPTDVQSLLL